LHHVRLGISTLAAGGLLLVALPAFANDTPEIDWTISQNSFSQVVNTITENEAEVGDTAFRYAKGNVGLNVASGFGNQQANATYARGDASNCTGCGDTFTFELADSNQHISGAQIKNSSVDDEGTNPAQVNEDAFRDFRGNAGVNVAAGNLNQQMNVAALSAKDFASADVTLLQAVDSSHYNSNGWDNPTNHAWINKSDDTSEGVTSFEDNAFQNVQGNVGVNVAAGNGNQQANVATVTEGDCGCTHTATDLDATQRSDGNFSGRLGAPDASGENTAQISTTAFQHAVGNVGANVTAGEFNAQLNVAAISTNDLATSSIDINQSVSNGGYYGSPANEATLNERAFEHFTGNAGVNISAGNSNQQVNVLNATGFGTPVPPVTLGP
jgi:hypothetical protein